MLKRGDPARPLFRQRSPSRLLAVVRRNVGIRSARQISIKDRHAARGAWPCARTLTLPNCLRLLVGLWVLDTPFAYAPMGVGPEALWNHVAVGACVVILAVMRMVFVKEAMTFGGANLLLGLWLCASPWIFEYVDNGAALANTLVSGTLITLLATWSLAR